MGAQVFTQIANRSSAQEAFRDATEQARYDNGHGGSTGSLAEKSSFVVIASAPHTVREAYAKAENLIDAGDERIDDKWGPAGAIRVIDLGTGKNGPGVDGWLFFGWASS